MDGQNTNSKAGGGLTVGGRTVPLVFHRNLRARKYILRVRPDGSARVTIPRGGSESYAVEFAMKHQAWVQNQLEKQSHHQPVNWSIGTSVLLHGSPVPIEEYAPKTGVSEPERVWKIKNCAEGEIRKIRFSNHILHLPNTVLNFKPYIELLMKRLATQEITQRTIELARQFSVPIVKVVIRNQRSRWGSCSHKRTISLNWRLIQTPALVRDYMILHELAHVRNMDHSAYFWSDVERMCPEYRSAERWLKENQRQLFQS